MNKTDEAEKEGHKTDTGKKWNETEQREQQQTGQWSTKEHKSKEYKN